MGETRVDLLHLLEDLRDAYVGPIEETILTEVIANSLDSGATFVALRTDPAQGDLTVADNGSGMTRRELARYHDLAASTKARGQGIGFAGVGIKLGLIACDEVITETRRGKVHVATSWRLASRHRAPWRWIAPAGVVADRGTAVRLRLTSTLSPLLDAGFLETTIRRHYATLLDTAFDEFLAPYYPRGVAFEVNGGLLEREPADEGREPIVVRLARKRKPAAIGYLQRHETQLHESDRGVAISTYGKVIKRGWDWLGIAPATPDRVSGLIEAPLLSAALSLNKTDFVRSGTRGATYLVFRKAIQEAVSTQLARWGDDRRTEPPRPAPVRMRELERVLEQLAGEFPLLGALVEQRRGGQTRLPWRGNGKAVESIAELPMFADAEPEVPAEDIEQDRTAVEPRAGNGNTPPPAPSSGSVAPPEASPAVNLPRTPGVKRPGRYGLHVEFEHRPGDPEPARLVESTIHVNEAHPAYRRAALSRSLGYHIGIAVALALAPLAADRSREHEFLTSFLSRWGEGVDAKPSRRA